MSPVRESNLLAELDFSPSRDDFSPTKDDLGFFSPAASPGSSPDLLPPKLNGDVDFLEEGEEEVALSSSSAEGVSGFFEDLDVRVPEKILSLKPREIQEMQLENGNHLKLDSKSGEIVLELVTEDSNRAASADSHQELAVCSPELTRNDSCSALSAANHHTDMNRAVNLQAFPTRPPDPPARSSEGPGLQAMNCQTAAAAAQPSESPATDRCEEQTTSLPKYPGPPCCPEHEAIVDRLGFGAIVEERLLQLQSDCGASSPNEISPPAEDSHGDNIEAAVVCSTGASVDYLEEVAAVTRGLDQYSVRSEEEEEEDFQGGNSSLSGSDSKEGQSEFKRLSLSKCDTNLEESPVLSDAKDTCTDVIGGSQPTSDETSLPSAATDPRVNGSSFQRGIGDERPAVLAGGIDAIVESPVAEQNNTLQPVAESEWPVSFTADFGSLEETTTGETAESCNWGTLSEEHQAGFVSSEQVVDDGDDDEFGDFDDASGSTIQTAVGGTTDEKFELDVEALVVDLFPLRKAADLTPAVAESPCLASSCQKPSDCPEVNQLFTRLSGDEHIWRPVEDPASTPALDYSWSASSTYSILLALLNIDTRIVLDGESWRNSRSGSGRARLVSQSSACGSQPNSLTNPLGILLPTKVSYSPATEAKIELDSPEFDWSLPDDTPNADKGSCTQPSHHPNHNGALLNPSSSRLSGASGRNSLSSENLAADPVQSDLTDRLRSRSQTGLERVTVSGGGGRYRPTLSAEAKTMLDSFPLLNFMRSSVLVYPTRTVGKKSQARN